MATNENVGIRYDVGAGLALSEGFMECSCRSISHACCMGRPRLDDDAAKGEHVATALIVQVDSHRFVAKIKY